MGQIAGKAMIGKPPRLAELPRMVLGKACCRSSLNDELLLVDDLFFTDTFA